MFCWGCRYTQKHKAFSFQVLDVLFSTSARLTVLATQSFHASRHPRDEPS